VQFGVGERGARSRVTGDLVAGPPTLSEEELARNRADFAADLKSRPLMDPWYAERTPDWSKVKVPLLSAGNWGGQGLHLRGNTEGYLAAGSEQKWLELHGIAHWTHFYTDYGIALQKRFLDYFVKGRDNGWDKQAPVILQVRHFPERYVERHEAAWPIPRTRWTKRFLEADGATLSLEPASAAGSVSYDATGPGLTFLTEPLQDDTEVTGPIGARLWVSSTTTNADLFLVLRVFDPDGNEITYQGALDPNTPISQGWLRASHRKIDPERSLPYRPWHPHDELLPVVPGEIYPLDIEIWPTCIVVPAGFRIGLTVRGSDYHYEGQLSEFARTFHYSNHGVGPFTHNDPDDRGSDEFKGTVTVHVGGGHDSHILLPIIPAPS
jgi:predicted acyl esterase